MSAYIRTDQFFKNACLVISVNFLLSPVSNINQRSQIKIKIISNNIITCSNTATGSASWTVLCLPPWMQEVCTEILSEHPRVPQVWVILDQFIILVRPWNSSSLVLTSSLGSSARDCHSEQQFPPSSLHGFTLAAVCKLYILGSIT